MLRRWANTSSAVLQTTDSSSCITNTIISVILPVDFKHRLNENRWGWYNLVSILYWALPESGTRAQKTRFVLTLHSWADARTRIILRQWTVSHQWNWKHKPHLIDTCPVADANAQDNLLLNKAIVDGRLRPRDPGEYVGNLWLLADSRWQR